MAQIIIYDLVTFATSCEGNQFKLYYKMSSFFTNKLDKYIIFVPIIA
jgi:hypothetical protein